MYPIERCKDLIPKETIEIKKNADSFSLLLARHSKETPESGLETLYEKQCTPLITYIKSIRVPQGVHAIPLEDRSVIVINPKDAWEYNVNCLKKVYFSLSDSDLLNISPPEGLLCEHIEAQTQALIERLVKKGKVEAHLTEERENLALKSAFLSLGLALQEVNRQKAELKPEIDLKNSSLKSDEVSLLFDLLRQLNVFYLNLDLSGNLIDDKALSSIQSYVGHEECLATVNLKNNMVKGSLDPSFFCHLDLS